MLSFPPPPPWGIETLTKTHRFFESTSITRTLAMGAEGHEYHEYVVNKRGNSGQVWGLTLIGSPHWMEVYEGTYKKRKFIESLQKGIPSLLHAIPHKFPSIGFYFNLIFVRFLQLGSYCWYSTLHWPIRVSFICLWNITILTDFIQIVHKGEELLRNGDNCEALRYHSLFFRPFVLI